MVNITEMYPKETSFQLSKTTNNALLKSKVEKLLTGKIFIGKYLEKLYADSLETYRDIVIIDMEEKEFIKSLKEVQKLMEIYFGSNTWFGITSVAKEYYLWVTLEQVPVGRHWFQISSVELNNNEISLKLKHLRLIDINVNKTYEEHDFSVINLKEIVNFNNVWEMLKFTSVVIMTLITFFVNALWYLGNYSLILIHESSNMIQALTPIILGLLKFFTNCVGGLYWLIYSLWRSNSLGPPSRPLSFSFDKKSQPREVRAIKYNKSSNDTSNW